MSNENQKNNTDSIIVPTHVAIIPDGNRRWAAAKGLPSIEGHRQGAQNFEKLLDAARELGIKAVTGWFFSTENWKRTEKENEFLFSLARELAKQYREKVLKENIRFVHLGRKDRFPEDIIKTLSEIEELSKDKTDFTVGIALDYGGHDEIIRTIKKLGDAGLEITEENIEKNLDTKDLPLPDLIIRPGGEVRLSGFFSWQSAYSEFYFSEVLFPDFDREELKKAVAEYSRRDRRYGGNANK